MANPFLVLGGIAISVATAAFGILQVPGWVASAQDAAATNDIAQVSAAQAAMVSERGTYASSFDELADSGSVKVTTSGGVRLYAGADVTGQHLLTVARSASGTYFARTSKTANIGSSSSLEGAVTAAGTTVTGPASARVTAEGVPLPAPGELSILEYTNWHMDPDAKAALNDAFTRWSGIVGTVPGSNRVTGSVVDAPWSKSGTAVRSTWHDVQVQRGDFAVRIHNMPLDSEVTVRFLMVVHQPATLSRGRVMNMLNNTGDDVGVVLGSSHPAQFSAPVGVPIEVWITARTPKNLDPQYKVGFDLDRYSSGLTVDISEVDAYLGSYDPDRPWFSATHAPDGLQVKADSTLGPTHAYR